MGLYLVSAVASWGHMLQARHVTCPEHGELIHLEDAAAEPTALTHQPRSDGASLTQTALPAQHQTHEHCAVAVHRRTPVYLSHRATVTESITTATVVNFVPRHLIRTASLPILQLAPKNSPTA